MAICHQYLSLRRRINFGISEVGQEDASLRHPEGYAGHTDTVAAVFTCAHCNAVPESLVDGKAAMAIVRHGPGCPTLLAQTRTRWWKIATSV